MRLAIRLIAVSLLAAATAPSAFAETLALEDALRAQGYVSVPISQGADRESYVEGLIHGTKLKFMLDLSNDDSLFDIRALGKLGIEFERTEIVIPTTRLNVRIHTGQIVGLEFAGKSTGAMLIHAGDVDAIYGVRPGTDGPDGVLGAKFLANYGALLDVKNQLLHLKFH